MAILVKSKTKPTDKNFWGTTLECFLDAQALYGRKFTLDVAAEPSTAKVECFYTSVEWLEARAGNNNLAGTGFSSADFNPKARIVGFDALLLPWENDWYCNPPFDLKHAFISKASEQCKRGRGGLMLLPYEPLTTWWQELVEPAATAVYEPDGRYNFYERDGVTKKSGVNFGSCFVLFTPHKVGNQLPRIRFNRGIHKQTVAPVCTDDVSLDGNQKKRKAA